MSLDPATATLAELFTTYRAVIRELRARSVVRTDNAPAGDYAEHLVAVALGGTLATSSTRSFDLTTPTGRRIQVKCRVKDDTGNNPRNKIGFRDFAFDDAAIVLLHSDYTVERAVLVPVGVVQVHSRPDRKGFRVVARPEFLDDSANTDITERLRDIAAHRRNDDSTDPMAKLG
jgi:hypothetical protein